MIGELQSFYAGRRILVTGHTGFKGSWLCCWLNLLGARVSGLALPPEAGRPSLFKDADISSGMASHIADIRDLQAVDGVLAKEEPQIVFHLAAQPLVRHSYFDPVGTYATNVMGTVHVLDAMRRCPSVEAAVIVTTDKCYANEEWVWPYRETDRLGGKDPYSSSKACAELVVDAYRSTLLASDARIKVASARGGNVIGGGDWSEDRLIPDIVRALVAGGEVVLRNPGAVRPWQHVLELVRGYLMLGMLLCRDGSRHATAWNFGPDKGNEVTVEILTHKFLDIWGAGPNPIRVEPSSLAEATYLRLDHSKAATGLGWRPTLDFEVTVDLTASWYRDHLKEPGSARALLERQMADYVARLAQ